MSKTDPLRQCLTFERMQEKSSEDPVLWEKLCAAWSGAAASDVSLIAACLKFATFRGGYCADGKIAHSAPFIQA
jgi:hypothetical protein